MCDFIPAREDVIQVTTLGECRVVTRKVMMVIKEAHLVERKRRQTSRMKRIDTSMARTQRAEDQISEIRRGGMMKDVIEKSLQKFF